MKMMNVLDMMGNQIQEFLVHNGSVKGQGAITANTGKMVYNEGDRSMYYGYDNSTDGKGGDLLWSRLVDVAHLSQALSEDSVYAWAKKISESSIEVDENTFSLSADTVKEMLRRGGEAYLWGNHEEQNYAKSFTARKYIRKDSDIYPDYRLTKNKLQEIGGPYPYLELVYDDTTQTIYMHVTADSWNGSEGIFELYFEEWDSVRGVPALESLYGEGYIMSIDNTGDVYTCTPYGDTDWVKFGNKNSTEWTEEVRASVSAEGLVSAVNNANTVYSWGNHADAGYARACKIEHVVDEAEFGVQVYDDKSGLFGTGWLLREIVFGSSNTVLGRVAKTGSDGKEVSAYLRRWEGMNNIPEPSYYKQENMLLFVKENASVYKYENGAWVLYLSGASDDVVEKIDDIKNALGLDEQSGGIINTWNEMKAFFAGVDSDDALLARIAEIYENMADKANDADVIKKPTTDGLLNDVLISTGSGETKWSTKKITALSKRRVGIADVNYIVDNVWNIDITALDTLDVCVSLYKITDSSSMEMVMADVHVENYAEGEDNRQRVRIVFGDAGNDTYKVVITA